MHRVVLAVRDLQQLDGALAELATALGMTVTDFDTATARPVALHPNPALAGSSAPQPGRHAS